MKSIFVKKGEKVGFHQVPASRDFFEVRGKKSDVFSFAAGRKTDLKHVSGDMAPQDEVYGRVYV